MLEFNTQKEVNDIFTHLITQKPHLNVEIHKLKKLMLQHIVVRPDPQMEVLLDELQNTLAVLEEKRDDLIMKLAFTRRNIKEELRTDFKNMNYLNEIKQLLKVDEEEIVINCGARGYEFNNDCGLDDIKEVVGKVEAMVLKEVDGTQKEGKEDVYQVALGYFHGR